MECGTKKRKNSQAKRKNKRTGVNVIKSDRKQSYQIEKLNKKGFPIYMLTKANDKYERENKAHASLQPTSETT